jgi:hypothetical protein
MAHKSVENLRFQLLDVLFLRDENPLGRPWPWGRKIPIFGKNNKFSLYCFQVLFIKTLDPYPH